MTPTDIVCLIVLTPLLMAVGFIAALHILMYFGFEDLFLATFAPWVLRIIKESNEAPDSDEYTGPDYEWPEDDEDLI